MPAKPGVEYSLDKLDFEIREINPSFASSIGFTWANVLRFLAAISLVAAVLALILYIYQTIKARRMNAENGAEVEMAGNGH